MVKALPHLDTQFDATTQMLEFNLQGRLDIEAVSLLWAPFFNELKKVDPKTVKIDAAKVDYCDSSGVALLLEVKKNQARKKGEFILENLSADFQQLFDLIDRIPVKAEQEKNQPLSFIARFGQYSVDFCRATYESIAFLGELSTEMVRVVKKPSLVRWKDMWRTVEVTGPDALPIVLLLGFLMGLIISFQSATPMSRFGAMVYIANLVSISLTRELGPLMVAIILAGRTASAFAAEIGTMKVNQEIDALKTMGIRPLAFLAVPRIIAVMLMTPFLNIFMIAAGLLGCLLLMNNLGYPWDIFYKQVNSAVTASDLWSGMFKSVVFGVMIAAIGCKHGLSTQLGASSVGSSTTKAVVNCIIMIVVVDGIFAVLFYVMGI